MGWLGGAIRFVVPVLFAGNALAHAMLDNSTPAVGSTVAAPPTEVVLEFSEQIEPTFSSVQVTDSRGTLVSQGTANLVPGRRNTLTTKLTAIGSGVYKVTWKAVSVDTHVTKGSFSFTVR
jgi:methionine-rich copper-binding protein CopC